MAIPVARGVTPGLRRLALLIETRGQANRSKGFGWRAPIEPGKGYSITMKRPGVCPDIPLIFPETRVAVTPFADGYRLGSTMEFSGYDDSINPKRLNLLRSGVEEYLKEPYGEP